MIRLFARCLWLLLPLRKHVVALCAGIALLTMALIPVGLILLDLFWTRALQGTPLPSEQAALLGLDPASAVHVAALTPELRRLVARRTVLAGVAALVLFAPVAIFLWYYQVWILQRLNQLLRVRLLERLQVLSLRFHNESAVGDALYRITQDSAMVTALVDVLLLTPLSAVGGYGIALALVTVIDPRLGLLLLAAWIPALAVAGLYWAPLRRDFRHARATNAALTARVQEKVAGMRVIKAYGAEVEERKRFEEASRRAFAAAFAARQRFTAYGILLFASVASILAAASAWAALETRAGAELFAARFFAISGVAGWNLGVFQFFKERFGDGTNQVRRLLRTWGRAQDVAAGLERTLAILDLEPEVKDGPGALDLPALQDGLVFRDVSFRYHADRPVLEGVNFKVPRGTVTAVVGRTGAGKSTLLSLALRLFDPTEGSVEIDGIDLRRLRLASLRANVAIVLQEPFLFGTTIRENIRYAVPAASDSAVRAAAHVACADEFIEKLPLGYETLLGERGTKLSSGQRQRLAIARAVLKDTPLVLLDEPTASLDVETEERILRNLATWAAGRAVLMVTHRLSTARHAGRIVVLDRGRVTESGSHRDLAAREGGAYRRLLEAQAVGERRTS